MRRTASYAAIILGVLMVIGGITTWFVVSNTLADEHITVAEDASCLAGREVRGPFTSYCQAEIIQHHALDATGGKTYAELDHDDPLRATAQNASFLRASLFTSVVAFGVAALGMGMGVVFVLIGLGIRDVEERTA